MTGLAPSAVRQAIDWHIALDDADETQWHAFVEWLEADEANRAAYDHVALDDASLTRPLPVTEMTLPRATERRTRRWAIGGAVAALAAGLVALLPSVPSPQRYTVETTRAAGRTIVIADGSRIDLNRDTRLILDRRDLRFAALEHGEAMFRIRHDAAAPFRVDVGGARLVDTGTVFNVVRDGTRLDVAVAEGGVIATLGATSVALHPGMMLARRGPGEFAVSRRKPADIGAWNRGRLVFSDTPLSEVAADLARATGVRIAVAPALGVRPFTGTVFVGAAPETAVRTLAALASAAARRDAAGWTLDVAGAGTG